MRLLVRLFALLVAVAVAAPATAQDEKAGEIAAILQRHDTADAAALALGKAAFERTCAACHNGQVERAPPQLMLGNLSPDAILRTLAVGAMREQGKALSQADKTAVAEYLTGRKIGSAEAAPLMCKADPDWFDARKPPALRGWGLDARNTHSIPASVAGIDRGNVGRLKLKWALAFPSVLFARSQPVMAAGAIFVGGDDGTIYALDRETGCARWTFHAQGPVRMGVVLDTWAANDADPHPRIYFGDVLGNAYALDARGGVEIWRKRMDPHANATLTASPALHEGVLYVPVSSLEEPAAAAPNYECCTFRGSVVALASDTGAELWRAWMTDPPVEQAVNSAGVKQFGPSGAAVWNTPLVDPGRGQLYVATGDNYSQPASPLSDAIVALALADGKVRWHHQATQGDAWNVACGWAEGPNCPEDSGPDFDFGAGTAMGRDLAGNDYLLAGQKSGIVYALDSATGALRWQHRAGRGGALGGVHFGLAVHGTAVIAPIADSPDGYEHDYPARPGIHAIDITSGKPLWSTAQDSACGDRALCNPGYGGAISVAGDLVLAGSNDGHARIFDAADGKLLWDFDTVRDFATVNGAVARGGSISGGSAPIAQDGLLLVNSGYGMLGKMPGNVLLVFATE